MKRLATLTLALAMMLAGNLLFTAEAQAFCGFYVSGSGDALYNDATQVVLMRHDTQTVLSMRNTYQGPPEDFAMVVPVPQVLEKDSVKVLPDSLFDKIERQSSPRLVEYWQRGRCSSRGRGKKIKLDLGDRDIDSTELSSVKLLSKSTVTVKARFEVGEYEVVILSATESNGLETWLLDNKYNIPKGAAKVLAPYIAQGQYFFVAKVDPAKVTFKGGRAVLSPLRFHYDSEDFSLPVRLGLLNAKGTQDLIVHTLGVRQRYQVANYKNVTIPTNLVVPERTRKAFSDFYNGLFDYTLALDPRSVVTEYAWDSAKCDPCAGPTLDRRDLHVLGLDTLRSKTEIKEDIHVTVLAVSSTIGTQAMMEQEWHRGLNKTHHNLNACYERFLSTTEDKPSGKIALSAEVTEQGTVKNVLFPWDDFKNKDLETCLTDVIEGMSFPAKMEGANQRYEIALSLDRKVYERVVSRAPDWGWTLTRLHARYTEKTMTEDLIFEKAPPIRGGVGMPQGERGTIALEGAELASINTFQGRYIILNYDKTKLSCNKSDRYYSWGGPPSKRPTDNFWGLDSSVDATRKSAKLSSKLEAAVRRQYRAPK